MNAVRRVASRRVDRPQYITARNVSCNLRMIMQMRPRTVRATREGVEAGRERAREQREKERGGWIRVLLVVVAVEPVLAFRKFFADIFLSLWNFFQLLLYEYIFFYYTFFHYFRLILYSL